MKLRRISFGLFIFSILVAGGSLPLRGDEHEDGDGDYVVIRAGRVITVSGETFTPGLVIIEDGKIRLVGQNLEYPPTARIIDARGKTVMPGLVLPRTRFGLPGYNRGGIKGALSAKREIYLSEIDFEPLLRAGYTTVGFIPDGNGMPGATSVYRTAGEESTRLVKERAYYRFGMANPGSDKQALAQALGKAKKEIEKVEKARQEWEKKRKEAEAKKKGDEKKGKEKSDDGKEPPEKGKGPPEKKEPEKKEAGKPGEKKAEEPAEFKPPPIDPDHAPLVDLIQEKKGAPPLVFELARASDLHHLDQVIERFPPLKADRFYLRLGFTVDYREVAEELGEREAWVLLAPVLSRLPYTVNRYSVAAELATAGCGIIFLPQADSGGEYLRVLPRVAEMVRSGLTRETALRALTLNPATLLGLGEEIGSLENGKRADIVFLNGDPFRPETRVERVMLAGEIVWEEDE